MSAPQPRPDAPEPMDRHDAHAPQHAAMPEIRHQASSLLQPVDPQGARRRAPWITVAGGKGGVGKTLLSVNTALQAARSGRRVLLVDFDPGLANIAVHLRLAPRFDLTDLINGECAPADAVVEGPAGLFVLCGRSGDPTLAGGGKHDAATSVRRALGGIEAVANAIQADCVFVDTGAGIGPSVIQAAGRAAATLCVTTPEPSALTDAYALMKVLRADQPASRMALVINRANSRDEAMRIAGRLQEVTRRFLGFAPDIAGWVREDRELTRSVGEQRPAALAARGEVLEDLRALFGATMSLLPSERTRARASARRAPARAHLAADVPLTADVPTAVRTRDAS